MIRTAREKIASKVSKFESVEDFHFAKWLRVPKIDSGEVTEISYSEDVEDFPVEKLIAPNSIKLKFRLPHYKVPEIKHNYRLINPKAYLIFFGISRPQLFTMKEKILSVPELKNLSSTFPQIPKVFDKSSKYIAKPATVIDHTSEFISKSSGVIDQSSEFIVTNVPTYNKSESFSSSVVVEIPLMISPPVITDELANLTPEIYNIELLNVEKFDNTVVDSKNYSVNELPVPQLDRIDVPGIDNIINSIADSYSVPFEDIPQADVQFYSPSFDIPHPVFKVKIESTKTVVKKVVIKQKNLEPVVFDALNDPTLSESAKAEINSLLSAFRELNWEEYYRMLNALTEHQFQSAQFLAANNYAVLNDELGYDKFDQTSAAIGFIAKKGSIKSALLISDNTRLTEYWTASLKSYAKELKVKKIEPGSTKKLKGNSVIWCLDINDIGKVELKEFDKLDLIIFDELVNLKSASAQIDQLVTNSQPDYIWMLSAIINEKAVKKYLNEFEFSEKVSFNIFGSSLKDIQADEPSVITKDIWLYLDEMQSFEYAESLNQSKKELNTLFENPNPLRFQSNIFSIIHKLKQILNFSSFRNISPKANLLIEQVETIALNKKKVVVFTQYDGNGLKKIEKAFELNNIKFVVGRNGMSTDELKQSLASFYDRSDMTVFLTNLKPSRMNIKLNKVPYIINFDQWWNPITQWQNDDEIGISQGVQTPVVIYNYHIKNTFEEELNNLIHLKGLDNRYLFDNLKSETVSELISMNDWLYVFGLNDQGVKSLNSERTRLVNKMQSIELNSFKLLMKSFFSFLGYRDISIMDIADEPMFYIIGSGRKGSMPVNLHGKCLLTSELKKDDYEEIIHFKPAANEIKRKFVITTGTFAERVSNGTMYIDGKDLANFIITSGLKSQLSNKK